MARLYQTRSLLDPSMLQYVGNVADRRLQNEMELNQRMGNSIRGLLSKGGQTLDEYVAKKKRQELFDQWNITPEMQNDPVFKANWEEYERTGNAGGITSYLNNQKNIDLQRKSQQWHSDVQDRERMAGYERSRQQAENNLSYINAALSKDPNNLELQKAKSNAISDVNFFRGKLGMDAYGIEPKKETVVEEKVISEQTNEPTNVPQYSNEDINKIFKSKLNGKVWDDATRSELTKLVETITDPALKEAYTSEIMNKGVTEEDVDRFIAENNKNAVAVVIPPEYKDKVIKITTPTKFVNGKMIPERTTLKRKK